MAYDIILAKSYIAFYSHRKLIDLLLSSLSEIRGLLIDYCYQVFYTSLSLEIIPELCKLFSESVGIP